jgi:hypothetical protein
LEEAEWVPGKKLGSADNPTFEKNSNTLPGSKQSPVEKVLKKEVKKVKIDSSAHIESTPWEKRGFKYYALASCWL